MEYRQVDEILFAMEQAVSAKPSRINDADRMAQAVRKAFPDLKVKSANGASKECLVFPTLGYVLKWTVNTREAERELAVYNEATKAGLSPFFPDTFRAGVLTFPNDDDIVVVAQQIVPMTASRLPWDGEYGLPAKLRRIAKTVPDARCGQMERQFRKADLNGYGRNLDNLWARVAVSLYGKRRCIALCEFVKKFHINDLHGSNIGYIGTKPVLLDFSGFCVRDDFEF